jgi:transcriptional regulator with XRE-family HTH domain
VKKPRKKSYFKDEAFQKKVGENIRRIRHSKGLTQMELAFKCNEMDYSQINRMERGKINFSISYISLLASVLEVRPEELVTLL